jgi:hypothetical protein
MTSTDVPPSKNRRVVFGGRSPPQPGEIADRLVRGVGGDGGRQAAPAVPKRSDPGQVDAGFAEEVDAGDPEVGDAVPDELDDVVRADEQDVEVEILDARDETPIMLLEDEAGVVQKRERRFD